jgi:tRNA (guanine26-N2/guanine27-N2)-dimethyltransferase
MDSAPMKVVSVSKSIANGIRSRRVDGLVPQFIFPGQTAGLAPIMSIVPSSETMSAPRRLHASRVASIEDDTGAPLTSVCEAETEARMIARCAIEMLGAGCALPEMIERRSSFRMGKPSRAPFLLTFVDLIDMAEHQAEGKIMILPPDGVFYNPEMELCRDMFSVCVGALPGKLSLIDAMCASGARGLRYKKENRNIGRLILCDQSKKAIACAKKSAKANKVKCRLILSDARKALPEADCDIVELDPFGSPQPFLNAAARNFEMKKKGYLSVTATDMAVLCGAHHAACLKNYFSTPLDNEFCHENAARILAATVVREFSPLNMSAVPIFTFSHRHYVKIMFEVKRDAASAVEAVKKTGYVSYCTKCCFREARRAPVKSACPNCSHPLLLAGPMWIGELWDGVLVKMMLALNAKRNFRKAAQIEKMLSTIEAESRIASVGYYDLHTLAKKGGKKIHSMDGAIAHLRQAGFLAARTHFCPTAVRTDAPHKKVLEMLP